MMKKKGFLLATAATGAAAFAPGAMAADMPVKGRAPVVVPPAVSWAGWYIGVHAGVNWHLSHNTNVYDHTTTGNGFIGGGQIGYNWQNGNFVFGLEADGSWLSTRNTTSILFGNYSASNRVQWLSTVRGRFGLAVGNTMAYATGGVAFGGVKNKYEFDAFDPSPFSATRENSTRVGWVIGGGIEHMWSRNWSIALEGLFVDLGHKNANHVAGNPIKTTRFDNQLVIGRAKLNYRF